MKFKIPNTSGVAGFWFVVWFLFTNILPGQGIVDDGNPVGYIAFFLFACFGITAFVERRKKRQ